MVGRGKRGPAADAIFVWPRRRGKLLTGSFVDAAASCSRGQPVTQPVTKCRAASALSMRLDRGCTTLPFAWSAWRCLVPADRVDNHTFPCCSTDSSCTDAQVESLDLDLPSRLSISSLAITAILIAVRPGVLSASANPFEDSAFAYPLVVLPRCWATSSVLLRAVFCFPVRCLHGRRLTRFSHEQHT